MEDARKTPVLSHGQMKAISERMKAAKEERYMEQSKQRLDKIVSTKTRTAFIGALSAFEDTFGFLWGQGLTDDKLTEAQIDMRILWNNVRTKVLNNGNNQLRALRTEIANQTVTWNRYHTNFMVKPEENEDGE